MPRTRRLIRDGETSVYHVVSRTALDGGKGFHAGVDQALCCVLFC